LLGAAAFLGWFLLYWKAGLEVAHGLYDAWKTRRTALDAPLLSALTIFSAVMLAFAPWLAITAIPGLLPHWLETLGLLLLLMGIAGMFICRHFLGAAWTAQTRTPLSGTGQPSQRPDTATQANWIVSHGPYGLVRHPIYTCASLTFLGAGLLFSTGLCLMLSAAVILLYIFKTNDEDRYLLRNLPGYQAYSQRVKYRLLPGIW
jgi:protein-S-isoprenylcysteine O-methyltransferase Ste14